MADRIMVTGATGFLGRHLLPILEARFGADNVIGISSKDADLMDRSQVEHIFEKIAPDVVIHLAAYSGGIGANRLYPADFYFQNTLLTALTFEVAAKRKIKKLIYTMGGCSYPAKAKSPIDEDQLFCGYPQAESAGYSTAKMMGVVAARSYREQYGLNATVLIPGNMYGEYDNFRTNESHVIPAMLRRYHEAKLSKQTKVEMWGTGKPERDFVYAGDVARCIPFFINSYNDIGPVNISTGTTTPIKTLAETVAKVTNFEGEIAWDATKPDGQMIKVFAVERLKALGLSCDTSLENGLKKTADWLLQNFAAETDGLRL